MSDPTNALRNALICLLKGDDVGSADGLAQVSAWIMETAKGARDAVNGQPQMEAAHANEAGVCDATCGNLTCSVPRGHKGPHKDQDGLVFAPGTIGTGGAKLKLAKSMGPDVAKVTCATCGASVSSEAYNGTYGACCMGKAPTVDAPTILNPVRMPRPF